MNAIETHNLTKKFSGFTLDGINFSLPTGSIMGLVGENGAGKSTLIKLIMNALKRDSGSVRVLGTDCESPEFTSVKEDIGIVLDEAYYPEVLTSINVAKIMKSTYKNWDNELYFNYLNRFDLNNNKKFKDYSRGMKMKLSIAVALSHKPKLLILDEATSGLDPIIRDEILDIFNEFTLDESHSVLISSHIVSDLEKICDYIAFIHRGKLLLCEEKDKLLEKYAVVKMPKSSLEALPPEAVKGVKTGVYGSEALVLKDKIPSAFVTEHTTLEEIILFIAKGGEKK